MAEERAVQARMVRRTFLKVAVASLLWGRFSSAAETFFAIEDGALPNNNPGGEDVSALANPIKDYLYKVRNPDLAFSDDVYLDKNGQQLLLMVLQRLERLRAHVGDGNFTTISFDEAVSIANRQVSVEQFSEQELTFMEMIHGRDAKDYGFYGAKQVTSLTQRITPSATIKIPNSGNYLFKGESFEKFGKIRTALGEEVVLTSGIRGIVKQFHLFLNKTNRHGGNLSLASRSLAPPGYSYHAIGDFDIGQKGFGTQNFTERFESTPVYRFLTEKGYIDNRYWRDNAFGVRYEPWHIKL
jgi:zinc D-Ala-D-Ala carboxypeptidase